MLLRPCGGSGQARISLLAAAAVLCALAPRAALIVEAARVASPGPCPVGFFATARGSTWECTLCKGYELRDGAAERSALPVCPKGQWLQDGCRATSDVSGLRYDDPSTWPAEHDADFVSVAED